MNLETIILAAGKGSRMKSKLPKVLHKVGGKPMLQHVIDAAKTAGSTREVVVIGSGAELVEKQIAERANYAARRFRFLFCHGWTYLEYGSIHSGKL